MKTREAMAETKMSTEASEQSPAAPGEGPASGGPRRPSRARMGGMTMTVLRQVTLLPALIVLLIVGSIVSPAFLTSSNLTGIGQQISSLGVVVVGEALVLLTGGMDLSLESTYGFAPMVAAWLLVPKNAYGLGTDWAPVLGLLVLVAVGVAVGLVNGLLIVKGRLNGFIVTLAMTIVLEGLQNGIVHGQSLFNMPSAFVWLGSAQLGSVPVSLIACALIFAGVGVFLRYHRAGRAIYALGGNLGAARAAGIDVDRVRIGCYVAGSVLAAIGGLMEAGRVSAVTSTQGYGEGIIFPVFAAAVIGGVSLKGGRGNMVGAASGVILLGILLNILNLANVSSYWIDAIYGSVILVALVLARVVGGAETVE
jgi:ribose/xylose/arabinose/galactoside ABC-type transport system permease subunit